MGKRIEVPAELKDVRNKPAFDVDCLTKIPNLDPLAKAYDDFPWEQIYRDLDGEPHADTRMADIAHGVSELLRWIVRSRNLNTIGRRAVALAWTVNPAMFENLSLTTLAKRFGLSFRKMLSRPSGEARRSFDIQNRAQDHAWNFKAQSARPGKAKARKRKARRPLLCVLTYRPSEGTSRIRKARRLKKRLEGRKAA